MNTLNLNQIHYPKQHRGKVLPVISADLYISVISSGQELPDLEALHEADPEKPMIFFNLNLETVRSRCRFVYVCLEAVVMHFCFTYIGHISSF